MNDERKIMSSIPLEKYHDDVVNRLFERDETLWSDDPEIKKTIANRLGWLGVASDMLTMVKQIDSLVETVRLEGFEAAVLLGMGGSSLCPIVLKRMFGVTAGYLDLEVLDTTDSKAIKDLEERIDIEKTVFIVASKSGTTIEPLSLLKYFWQKVESVNEKPGRQFIAITDPGTSLEALALDRKFRAVLSNPADIGGRYSALSYFGLLPAALIGIDIEILLDNAVDMANRCRLDSEDNPALRLGYLMAEQALSGRDKLTLVTSKKLLPLGLWVEQLVAESTGKKGKGIIPITGERSKDAKNYSSDRFFVSISLSEEDNDWMESWKESISDRFTHYEFEIDNLFGLGGHFWLWEAATAICGAYLEINPFDEPNVTESKNNTNRLLDDFIKKGSLPKGNVVAESDGISIRLGKGVKKKIKDQFSSKSGSLKNVKDVLKAYLSVVDEGNYIVFQAYLPENAATTQTLETLRNAAFKSLNVATMAGFGPRYLHSTGQEQKGGPPSGIFIQLTHKDKPELKIPDEKYTFPVLEEAQARGDFEALEDHDLPVIGIELSSIDDDVLNRLTDIFSNSLSEVGVGK